MKRRERRSATEAALANIDRVRKRLLEDYEKATAILDRDEKYLLGLKTDDEDTPCQPTQSTQ